MSETNPTLQNLPYDYLFKLLLIGDSGVGKSCMLVQYTDGTFNDSFISTIGVDFKIKTIDYDGSIVKLQIWDTAGQERFQTITSSYYRGAHAIMIVYDVTDLSSFQHIKKWIYEIEKYAAENVVKIIVGNKTDLQDKRVVEKKQVDKFCQELGLVHIETSAKDSSGIEDSFLELARQLKKKRIEVEAHVKLSHSIDISGGRRRSGTLPHKLLDCCV